MAPPRIIYFIDDLRAGGATRQLAMLAEALRPHATPVVCCLSRFDAPVGNLLRDAGIGVHVFPRRIRHDPRLVPALARLLRRENAAMVHGWLDASGAYAYMAGRLARIPVLCAIRSDRLRLSGARASVFSSMLRRADAVTVNSRAGYRHLVEKTGTSPHRTHWLPNWVSVPTTPPASPRSTDDMLRIVCSGRLVELKRMDRAIDAVVVLKARGVHVSLDILGDGPLRADLERRTAQANVSDRVTFHGMVPDVSPFLEKANCLVLPSEFEGLPNAALEALAHGVPVVAFAVGDLPDVIESGVTGQLVGDTTGDKLADAIGGVLSNPELQERARISGPALMRERFSLSRGVGSYLALYDSLTQK